MHSISYMNGLIDFNLTYSFYVKYKIQHNKNFKYPFYKLKILFKILKILHYTPIYFHMEFIKYYDGNITELISLK